MEGGVSGDNFARRRRGRNFLAGIAGLGSITRSSWPGARGTCLEERNMAGHLYFFPIVIKKGAKQQLSCALYEHQ